MTAPTDSAPDVPLGDLPPATWVLLRKSPLQVVVAEVRWARTGPELTGEHGLELRDAAAEHGLHLARIDPVRQQQVHFEMRPEGPAAVVNAGVPGLKLSTSDGAISVTVMPDSLVVQCNAYSRWSESLAPQVAAAVAAVTRVVQPRLFQRVGLRYVNRLVSPDAVIAQSWRDRIEPTFLGPLLNPELGVLVASAQQQVELRLTDTAAAIIRHGPYRDAAVDNTFAYLLDIDVFDTRSERFDPEAVSVLTRQLNRTAASLFQQIVPDQWRETMGPYTESAPDDQDNAQGQGDRQEEAE